MVPRSIDQRETVGKSKFYDDRVTVLEIQNTGTIDKGKKKIVWKLWVLGDNFPFSDNRSYYIIQQMYNPLEIYSARRSGFHSHRITFPPLPIPIQLIIRLDQALLSLPRHTRPDHHLLSDQTASCKNRDHRLQANGKRSIGTVAVGCSCWILFFPFRSTTRHDASAAENRNF